MKEIRTIKVERVKNSPSDWDAFAIKCNASHMELSGWIRFRQIRSHIPFGIYTYNILHCQKEHSTKIGQFAVGFGLNKRIFAGGLHLLPEYHDAWPTCMEMALNELGPGQYVYGSDWSFEPPREHCLSTLVGVTVTDVQRYMTEAVDFARWNSWEDYQKAISTNIKRSVKKAKDELELFKIEIKYGVTSAALFHKVYYAKYTMLRRKLHKLRKPRLLNFLLLLNPSYYFIRMLLTKNKAFSAILSKNRHVVASFSGVEVGNASYYFEGGTIESNGAGWLLNMSLMHDFYMRHPTGRFVLGCQERKDDQLSDGWESSVRYRQRARVSGFPCSRVTFTFSR
jgi:hypothetical protein